MKTGPQRPRFSISDEGIIVIVHVPSAIAARATDMLHAPFESASPLDFVHVAITVEIVWIGVGLQSDRSTTAAEKRS
jgi:hypothetical protein